MGDSYMKRDYLTASHVSRGLWEYQKQDVSTVPGCINPFLRSMLRWASKNDEC
jgi:hypothetical protein